MKLYAACIGIYLLLTSSLSYARTMEYDGKCRFGIDYYSRDYSELTDCTEKELIVYKKKIDEIYEYYFAKENNRKMKQVQALWMQFRIEDCLFWASKVMDGYINDAIYNACSIKKIKKRIKDLQEPSLREECLLKANYTEALNCLEQEQQNYNEELTKLYEPLSTDQMKKTQLSWGNFKVADCDYKASKANGKNEYTLIYNACLLSRTKERADELNTSLLSVDWFQDADKPKKI